MLSNECTQLSVSLHQSMPWMVIVLLALSFSPPLQCAAVLQAFSPLQYKAALPFFSPLQFHLCECGFLHFSSINCSFLLNFIHGLLMHLFLLIGNLDCPVYKSSISSSVSFIILFVGLWKYARDMIWMTGMSVEFSYKVSQFRV